MDMKDLSAVRVAGDLERLGVASLKIEGRLKSPEWVARAVALLRRACAGSAPADELWAEAAALGAYTGREMTDGYLTGRRVGLVHPDDGRAASAGEGCGDQDPPRVLAVAVEAEGAGLAWTLELGALRERFTTNRPQAHAGRAVIAAELRQRIAEALPEGTGLASFTDRTGGLRLPRRTANEIAARIALWARPKDHGVDRLKLDVGEAVRAALAPQPAHPANRLALDAAPGQARVDREAAAAFAAAVPEVRVVVEVRDAGAVEELHRVLGARLVAALPPVLYEGELAAAAAAVAAAVRLDVPVEANSWDGWELATAAGAVVEGGPGLWVYNPLAARQLARLGCVRVHAATELDGAMLADLCAACAAPLTVCVYGRPQLMATRAWSNAPGWTMEDGKRTVRIRTRREGGVVVLRPDQAFDWRARPRAGVRAALLEMDLSTVPPEAVADEWRSRPERARPAFNLERTLA
jgi:putative protease